MKAAKLILIFAVVLLSLQSVFAACGTPPANYEEQLNKLPTGTKIIVESMTWTRQQGGSWHSEEWRRDQTAAQLVSRYDETSGTYSRQPFETAVSTAYSKKYLPASALPIKSHAAVPVAPSTAATAIPAVAPVQTQAATPTLGSTILPGADLLTTKYTVVTSTGVYQSVNRQESIISKKLEDGTTRYYYSKDKGKTFRELKGFTPIPGTPVYRNANLDLARVAYGAALSKSAAQSAPASAAPMPERREVAAREVQQQFGVKISLEGGGYEISERLTNGQVRTNMYDKDNKLVASFESTASGNVIRFTYEDGKIVSSEYTDEKGIKYRMIYSPQSVGGDPGDVTLTSGKPASVIPTSTFETNPDKSSSIIGYNLDGTVRVISSFDKKGVLIEEIKISGVDEAGNLLDENGNKLGRDARGNRRTPKPTKKEIWQAAGVTHLFTDRWSDYVAWQQKSDAFFEDYLSIKGWSSLICNKYFDTDDAPSSIALGRDGLPGAHIEGERQIICVDKDGIPNTAECPGVQKSYLYKITFAVNPRHILKYDKYKLKFGVYVKDNAGNMQPVRLTQGVEGSHMIEIKKDTGEIRYAGSNMIVRQSNSEFTEVCLDFTPSKGSLDSVFNRYLDNYMRCNSLISSKEPKLPSSKYTSFGHAITFNWGGGKEDEGNQQNQQGRTADEYIPIASNTGSPCTGVGLC